MKILIVCTGNICRSPMAEVLLRRTLEGAGHPEVEVASFGTWGLTGSPATSEAIEVMRQQGIDMTSHQARSLERGDVEEADLVLAMTSVHLREIEDLAPGSSSKVLLMKELAEVEVGELPAGSSLAERVAALRTARRPEWRRRLDLDDPMGLPIFAYERAARQISEGIDHLAKILLPSLSEERHRPPADR